MLNYTYVYEETFRRCRADPSCVQLTTTDFASILNDIFELATALERHHNASGEASRSRHFVKAQVFAHELLELHDSGQQSKIRYMYYCSQLGPDIHELIDDSVDLGIKSQAFKWREERYCQHAEELYRSMYEITRVQQVRLVVYDETEVFLPEAEVDRHYPFKQRKNYVGPAIRLRPRKPIVGQYPPYQHNDFRLSDESRPVVPKLTARMSPGYVDLGQATNFTEQMSFLDSFENPLPAAAEQNYDGVMHYDFKKLKYSSYEISEFVGPED